MIGLEDLYKEYFQPVYLYLLSLTGDQSLSEDLTADTFISKSARKLPPLQVEDESQVPGSFFSLSSMK